MIDVRDYTTQRVVDSIKREIYIHSLLPGEGCAARALIEEDLLANLGPGATGYGGVVYAHDAPGPAHGDVLGAWLRATADKGGALVASLALAPSHPWVSGPLPAILQLPQPEERLPPATLPLPQPLPLAYARRDAHTGLCVVSFEPPLVQANDDGRLVASILLRAVAKKAIRDGASTQHVSFVDWLPPMRAALLAATGAK